MGKRLNDIYPSPLPVAVRPLPPLYLHNPVSVAYFLYDIVFLGWSTPKLEISGVLSADGDFVTVQDSTQGVTLWQMGFFGKGTLSRSDPTWHARTSAKFGLANSRLGAEDFTAQRRFERRKFKQERARAERLELERRKRAGVVGDEDNRNKNDGVKDESDSVSRSKDETETETHNAETDTPPEPHPGPSVEDSWLENGTLVQQEHVQLMPVEAVFLSYGLGTLKVSKDGHVLSPVELINYYIAQDDQFLSNYVAYHHFRSHGWCVRSGVKFGSDLLLYRRGPPFNHAEFAVMILPSAETFTHRWWWNTSVGRVVGGVKKTLVFCYVECVVDGFIASIDDFTHILETSKVREVVYRRWVASRNRE